MIGDIQAGRGAQRSSTQRFSGARGPKTLMVLICKEQTYRTDGTTTDNVIMLEIPELELLGPNIYRMRAHYESELATSANFTGKLVSQWSVSGKTWSTANPITTQVGSVHVMGSWITDTAEMGRLMRYSIAVKNASGAAIESARLTIYLEIELKS